MTSPEPGWELFRSFLTVFREGTLSGAARALALTQPTLGRHIDALEEALGITLFTRSPSGLIPTSAASALVPHAEAMSSAARALIRAASGEIEEERGSVRVTASEMIGTEVLPAALTAFRVLHPRIDVEVVLSNRSEDLLRRDADIAVRMVKPTQTALVAKKVGVLQLGLHAHPSYLKRHGTPRSLDALGEHALVGFDTAASVRRLPQTPVPLTRDVFAYRCDSDIGQYAAVKAGFGIGVCQNALGKRDGLVPVLPGLLEFQLETWVVMHQDLKTNRRVHLMFDHLVDRLKAHVALEAR